MWSIPAFTIHCRTIRSRTSPRLRACGVAQRVRGETEPRRQNDEGVCRARQERPSKFNVSAPPIGTTPQLEAEVLKAREGLQGMATVVFAGGGDALKALISDTVQLSSGVLAPAHPQIKAGTIEGLAETGAKRWHDLPDIPTMGEEGFNDFVFETYCALMAPAKTPPEIVAKLEKVALDILAKPDMKEKLTRPGSRSPRRPEKATWTRGQGGPDGPKDHRGCRH